jgi:hypothetical protein
MTEGIVNDLRLAAASTITILLLNFTHAHTGGHDDS